MKVLFWIVGIIVLLGIIGTLTETEEEKQRQNQINDCIEKTLACEAVLPESMLKPSFLWKYRPEKIMEMAWLL